LKSVTLQTIYVSDHWEGAENPNHNEDCPIAFVVEKVFSAKLLRAFTRDIAVSHPLIFLTLNSKAGIVEVIELFTNILAEAKSEEERERWAKSIKRLQKKLSLNLSEILEKALNAIQTGLFGLRIHMGLRNFAYLWKWRDRYFGFAYEEDSDPYPQRLGFSK